MTPIDPIAPLESTAVKSSSVENSAVYKRSEFSDLLTSNNFYTVSAIALVLGVASVFGFIQNPRKLKSVVDTISYKVSMKHVDNQRMSHRLFQQEQYRLSASVKKPSNNQRFFNKISSVEGNLYLFDGINAASKKKDIKRVAFSYDITSDQFWNDLDSSNIGQIKEDIRKDNYHSHALNLLDESNSLLDNSDSKYSLASSLRK